MKPKEGQLFEHSFADGSAAKFGGLFTALSASLNFCGGQSVRIGITGCRFVRLPLVGLLEWETNETSGLAGPSLNLETRPFKNKGNCDIYSQL